MTILKEKPAVEANGQYTKNGSDSTSIAPQNQGDDSAVYAALQLQEIAGKENRSVEPFIPIRDFSKIDHQVDAKPKLVVVTMKAFLTTQLPPRQLMLDPWLTTQSLNMIYAWRGIGKTHVALGIAYAVASGGAFLGWKADQPRGILYLDGEMPGNALQERLTLLAKQNGKEFPEENFRLVTPDLQKGAMPDLATPEGQQLIDSFILPFTRRRARERSGKLDQLWPMGLVQARPRQDRYFHPPCREEWQPAGNIQARGYPRYGGRFKASQRL